MEIDLFYKLQEWTYRHCVVHVQPQSLLDSKMEL